MDTSEEIALLKLCIVNHCTAEECVTMGATEELFKKYDLHLPTNRDKEKPEILQNRRENLQKLSLEP
jgi:hypothetical protein